MRAGWLVVLWCSAGAACDGETRDCEPDESRNVPNACGVCGSAAQQELCSDAGTWEPVTCVDPIDWDGDGWANETCDDLPGGCCTAQRDCNDDDPDLHAATFECTWRGLPGSPDSEACSTSCGTTGSRSCTQVCEWGDCVADEICNGVDDDCDTETDETPGGCP
jgi:hypothetical protein